MEITIETTAEDHISFYKEYGFKRGWQIKTFLLSLVDLALSAFYIPTDIYLLNVTLIGTLLFVVFYAMPYVLVKTRLQRVYDNLLSPTGQKTYRPFAIGLEILGDPETSFLRYEGIKSAGKTDNFIFFMLSNGEYHILPVWCFSSWHEVSQFLSIVQNGMASAKGIKQREPLTFKPIYLVGLLCLIPLIGFLAGLVLLILGLAHYKDRIFVVMGAVGMLLTVILYGSLFYFTSNSEVFKNGFATLAQSGVNHLVKNIEFYKLQNGAYPDSLQQLVKEDSFTDIYDPLLTFEDGKKGVTFQYVRKGNKYLLFSVGRDGKPNTADDIYPTLTVADTSKLGFIRKP